MAKKEYSAPLIIVIEYSLNDIITASSEVGIQVGDDFWTTDGGEQ